MNHNPLFSFIAKSFDHLFVVDKRGKTIFFPWGNNQPGYFIKSQRTIAKVKKFYRYSFFICVVALGITISFFHGFWAIVSSMVLFLGGWYLAYYLYTSQVTKHLLPAKVSYKDVVLEKLEPEDVEEEKISAAIQFTKQWSSPSHAKRYDPFLGLKLFWYRLTPAQQFIGFFFLGVFIFAIWSRYHPQQFGATPEDYLVAFLVAFLWGLSGFVMARNMESPKVNIWRFLNWHLPMILVMIVFCSFAIYSLYKYVVLKIM